MNNLAGRKEDTCCDDQIKEELERAGIRIVEIPQSKGEVEYSFIGELDTPYGKMIFRRAWYYWIVECQVPLELANRIYVYPEGKASVRAGGHCGCEPPETQAIYFCEKKDIKTCNGFVMSYHIDSQAGLLLFVLMVTGKVN